MPGNDDENVLLDHDCYLSLTKTCPLASSLNLVSSDSHCGGLFTVSTLSTTCFDGH